MQVTNPSQVFHRGLNEYKVTDETPESQSQYHRYSVLCWRRGIFNSTYTLSHGDNDITAGSFQTALKAYLVKQKQVK